MRNWSQTRRKLVTSSLFGELGLSYTIKMGPVFIASLDSFITVSCSVSLNAQCVVGAY